MITVLCQIGRQFHGKTPFNFWILLHSLIFPGYWTVATEQNDDIRVSMNRSVVMK